MGAALAAVFGAGGCGCRRPAPAAAARAELDACAELAAAVALRLTQLDLAAAEELLGDPDGPAGGGAAAEEVRRALASIVATLRLCAPYIPDTIRAVGAAAPAADAEREYEDTWLLPDPATAAQPGRAPGKPDAQAWEVWSAGSGRSPPHSLPQVSSGSGRSPQRVSCGGLEPAGAPAPGKGPAAPLDAVVLATLAPGEQPVDSNQSEDAPLDVLLGKERSTRSDKSDPARKKMQPRGARGKSAVVSVVPLDMTSPRGRGGVNPLLSPQHHDARGAPAGDDADAAGADLRLKQVRTPTEMTGTSCGDSLGGSPIGSPRGAFGCTPAALLRRKSSPGSPAGSPVSPTAGVYPGQSGVSGWGVFPVPSAVSAAPRLPADAPAGAAAGRKRPSITSSRRSAASSPRRCDTRTSPPQLGGQPRWSLLSSVASTRASPHGRSIRSPEAKALPALHHAQSFASLRSGVMLGRSATHQLARKQVCVMLAEMEGPPDRSVPRSGDVLSLADLSGLREATVPSGTPGTAALSGVAHGAEPPREAAFLTVSEAVSRDFLAAVFAEVRRARGAVYSFEATRVIAHFGAAPELRSPAGVAARCALRSYHAAARARQSFIPDRRPGVSIAVVLDDCVVGNVGTDDLLTFSVSGRAMELGRDVLQAAVHLGRGVLVNDRAAEVARGAVRLVAVDAGRRWAAGRWRGTRLFEATGPAAAPVPVGWQRGHLLGEGSFGAVFQCIRPDGSFFAMKVIDLADAAVAPEDVAGLMQEVRLMAELEHPNVVRYHGCAYEEDARELQVYMEHVDGGSLHALVTRLAEPLNEGAARTYTQQVVAGVAYLHRRGILHRDLKGSNILLSSRGVAKLADFGTSKKNVVDSDGAEPQLVRMMTGITLGPAASSRRVAARPKPTAVPPDGGPRGRATSRRPTVAGTVLWMAPEVHRVALKEADDYSFAADVWSVGCCLCEMLNRGQAPWKGFEGNIDATITIARWDGELPNNVPGLAPLSAGCCSFLRACLNPDPTKRPAAAELERHTWVRARGPEVAEAAPQQSLEAIEQAMRDAAAPEDDTSPTGEACMFGGGMFCLGDAPGM